MAAAIKVGRIPAKRQSARRADPFADARGRAEATRPLLLQQEGGVLSSAQVAERLHTTGEGVEELRKAGRLLGAANESGEIVYPAWQFEPDGLLKGLPEVISALRVSSPWVQMAFLLAENAYLDGQSPLSELRRGTVSAVLRAARAYGQHGAA